MDYSQPLPSTSKDSNNLRDFHISFLNSGIHLQDIAIMIYLVLANLDLNSLNAFTATSNEIRLLNIR